MLRSEGGSQDRQAWHAHRHCTDPSLSLQSLTQFAQFLIEASIAGQQRCRRSTIKTPRLSSSCLMPAESVGCVTLQALAARPKWRSRASAATYSR
jgi:hypothetical protein